MKQDCRQERFLEVADQYKEVIARICTVYASVSAPFADLYQEVMINLWIGLESWRGESKMSTWIYRIAINTCITWYRKNKRHASNLSIEKAFNIPDFSDDHAESLSELYGLIGRLDAFDKALITLWLDEKSYEEIALILGITKTNVGTRIGRIKNKLSQMRES